MKILFVMVLLAGWPNADLRAQAKGGGRNPRESGAQDKTKKVAAAIAAIEKWLQSFDDRDRLLGPTVDRIVAAKGPGLTMLASWIRRCEARGDDKELRGLRRIVRGVGERWLHDVEKSEMVYAGQYTGLKALMPDIGEAYLELLLHTPDRFPITARWKVIPALRDLYPKGPGQLDRAGIEAMAVDRSEPAHLRVGLAYALAQWGNRKLIRSKIRDLEKVARGEDEESAIHALRDLASIHYEIRDYMVAAVTNREFIKRAEAADDYLVPVYYYNAACCMCLSGDRRTALQYLERCLALNKSPKVDSSMRLKRKLFERDPEIAIARADKSFAGMLDKAFGPKDESSGKKKH